MIDLIPWILLGLCFISCLVGFIYGLASIYDEKYTILAKIMTLTSVVLLIMSLTSKVIL